MQLKFEVSILPAMESTRTQLPGFGRLVNYYQELEYHIENQLSSFSNRLKLRLIRDDSGSEMLVVHPPSLRKVRIS